MSKRRRSSCLWTVKGTLAPNTLAYPVTTTSTTPPSAITDFAIVRMLLDGILWLNEMNSKLLGTRKIPDVLFPYPAKIPLR